MVVFTKAPPILPLEAMLCLVPSTRRPRASAGAAGAAAAAGAGFPPELDMSMKLGENRLGFAGANALMLNFALCLYGWCANGARRNKR